MSALWCPLATPTVLLGFLLPWTWGISSWLLQPNAAAAPYLGWGVSSHSCPPDLERGVAPLGCRPWPREWVSSSRPLLRHRSLALLVIDIKKTQRLSSKPWTLKRLGKGEMRKPSKRGPWVHRKTRGVNYSVNWGKKVFEGRQYGNYWRRQWQPTPVLLPGESQGRGSLGLPSRGSHRGGHDWSDLAAAAW